MTNFNLATSNTAPRPDFIDIDLSVARDDELIVIRGSTFIFAMLEAFDGPTTISTTKSVGELFIKQNGNDAAPIYLTAGRSFYMQPTTKLFLTNEAQPNAMIRLLFTADGSQIIPFSTDIQATGLEALLKSTTEMRTPLTDLSDAVAYQASGAASGDFLSAAANVNGAIIRHACVFAPVNTCTMTVGGVALCASGAVAGTTFTTIMRDYVVGAGQAIGYHSGAGCIISAWIKTL